MAHIPFEPTIAGTQALPPFVDASVKVFAFPLQANAVALQNLCDQFLNIAPPAAGISFEPVQVAPNICVVNLEALDYTSLRSTTPPWDDFAGLPQHELFFSFPVVRKLAGATVETGIFIPYIFVDDQHSAITGREVLGAPKLLGSFTLARTFPASGPIKLRFKGQKTKGGPSQQFELVRITPLNPIATPALNTFTTNVMAGFSSRILVNPQSSLADSYRSIMRCSYVSTTTDFKFLPPSRVNFTTFLHLDIQAKLGIITNLPGSALSTTPYAIEADFSLEDLSTIWES